MCLGVVMNKCIRFSRFFAVVILVNVSYGNIYKYSARKGCTSKNAYIAYLLFNLDLFIPVYCIYTSCLFDSPPFKV